MSQTVVSTPDGNRLPIDDLALAIGYTGTQVTSLTVQYQNPSGILKTYVKTITYSGTQATNISTWVLQ